MGDKRQALLCVLAENCDEKEYKKLVQALCQEHQIPLIKVDSNQKLGEWAGLCKLRKTLTSLFSRALIADLKLPSPLPILKPSAKATRTFLDSGLEWASKMLFACP